MLWFYCSNISFLSNNTKCIFIGLLYLFNLCLCICVPVTFLYGQEQGDRLYF